MEALVSENIWYLLLIGLLIGMRHALEADHVAAVVSLTREKHSLSYTLKQGVVWGLGHTIALFLFASVVLIIDKAIPDLYASRLEFTVGVMLIILGADVLRRVIRDKIHFHAHRHDDGEVHFHAHSHKESSGQNKSEHGSLPHQELNHEHHHPDSFPFRALFVGLIHGMAGSAAVIILTLDTGTSPMQGMLFILLFGIGSMAGMALLSVAITYPVKLLASRLTIAHNTFQVLVGCFTIGLGVLVVMQNSASF